MLDGTEKADCVDGHPVLEDEEDDEEDEEDEEYEEDVQAGMLLLLYSEELRYGACESWKLLVCGL